VCPVKDLDTEFENGGLPRYITSNELSVLSVKSLVEREILHGISDDSKFWLQIFSNFSRS
jgi:hypothetical protein